MWTPSLLAILIVLVSFLVTVGLLVAIPLTACAWREGGWCDRRRSSASG